MFIFRLNIVHDCASMNIVHRWEDVMPVMRVDGPVRRRSLYGAAANCNVVPFPKHPRVTRRAERRAVRLRGPEALQVGLGAVAMVACGWFVAELVASLLATAMVTVDHAGSFECLLFRMGCLP